MFISLQTVAKKRDTSKNVKVLSISYPPTLAIPSVHKYYTTATIKLYYGYGSDFMITSELMYYPEKVDVATYFSDGLYYVYENEEYDWPNLEEYKGGSISLGVKCNFSGSLTGFEPTIYYKRRKLDNGGKMYGGDGGRFQRRSETLNELLFMNYYYLNPKFEIFVLDLFVGAGFGVRHREFTIHKIGSQGLYADVEYSGDRVELFPFFRVGLNVGVSVLNWKKANIDK
ncbi:MAG: hypothetical protein COC01_09890 [Bacteroidetes bacterium]|nr:hypothetical protein [Sphingobacteriaceae bacterium AH-315-L07]PCH65314.1 MAG: hypothetical protein COC01_09890 [Bacteroidota bacterium]